IEKRTPNQVTKSTRTRTSSPKSLVEKPRSMRNPLKKLGDSMQLLRSKSLLSVISKVSSRKANQRSFFRDGAFRNYPFGTSFMSQGSAPSNFSNKTQISISPNGGRKSTKKSKGFWGPNKIGKLKAKPMEYEVLLVKTQLNEKAGVQTKKTLKASNAKADELILSSDSEEDALLEAKSPVSEPEEPTRDEPAERNAFLEIFGSLPNISAMSSTETLDKVELPDPEAEFLYVNPVDVERSESDKSETPIGSLEELELLSASDRRSHASTDISLDFQIESEDESLRDHTLVEEPQVEDISVLMKNMDTRSTFVGFKTPSTSANEKYPVPSIDKIEEFLDDLLKEAAGLALRPRMQRILDPYKLRDQLGQLLIQYQDSLKQNRTLDNIISEYFIRRKEFVFVVEDEGIGSIHRPRLMEAIKALDHHLERERETKILTDNLVGKLKTHERVVKNFEVQKVDEFEAKVRETLLKDGYIRLPLVINDLFRMMNEVRNEVSKSRQKLSSVQHQLATMEMKYAKMNAAGNSVSEYLAEQADTQTLNIKLCGNLPQNCFIYYIISNPCITTEREVELKRLKDRVTYDLHTMAELREKEKLNRALLQEMKDKLKSKRLRQKQLRDLLYDKMMQRKCLKKETENIRRGCLMLHPDLLRDYDATEEHLQAKQKVIRKLRSEYNCLEQKLSQVESGDSRKKSILRTSI
ncbi:hypothetical protein KR059_009076, partial [Drosophila kikkawai]